ncbi:MAG: hypothetical protein WCT04_16260 [Planctomycetota bacterium]
MLRSRMYCARTASCLFLAVGAIFLSRQMTSAHPLSQGRMQVVVSRDSITLWASVALEEVVVQQSILANDDGLIVTQSDAYRAHGGYLLKHVFFTVDGKPLNGRVVSVQEPDNKTVTPGEPGKEYVVYELEFKTAALPVTIELRQNVLLEVEYTPGNPWQSTYITGIRQAESSQGAENLLLTSSNVVSYSCVWSATPATAPAQTVTKKAETPHVVPDEVKRPIPEAAPDRSHFIAGLAIGVCAMYLLAVVVKRIRRKTPS